MALTYFTNVSTLVFRRTNAPIATSPLGLLLAPPFRVVAMQREEARYPAQSPMTYLRRVFKCSMLLACTSPLLFGILVHLLGLLGVDHDKVREQGPRTATCWAFDAELQVLVFYRARVILLFWRYLYVRSSSSAGSCSHTG